MSKNTGKHLTRSASAGFAMVGLALFSGSYANGQVAKEIIVTGTRIKQTNLLASSPITSLSNEDIATRGVTRIEDLINELPQVFAAQGSNISSRATGIATVDLRGLGSSRTLVLIDGRRMASGTVNQVAADLNQIPAALVKNIDVLTGGAGAVYGSDALAGVVNFQMERDFEGLRLDMQIGAYQHNNNNQLFRSLLEASDFLSPSMTANQLDGATKDFTLVYGHNFENGKGNITAYLGYRSAKEIRQDARDFSSCTVDGGLDNGGLTACTGSIVSASGLFTDGSFDVANFLFALDPVTGSDFQRVTLFGQAGLPDVSRFNFNPDNFLQRPDERYTAGIFAHYDLSPRDEIYTDFMYADDLSIAQIAPSANFFNTDRISCDNPFLSDQQRDIICTNRGFGPTDNADLVFSQRNVDGGPRRFRLHHKSYRAVLGIRGEFRSLLGFEYDVSAQHSSANLSETFENALSISRLQRALLATTDASGNPVCDSVLDGTDPDCVPINYFSLGGVTQAALDYVSAQNQQGGFYKQTILLATISGNLGTYGIQIPGTSSGAKIILGSEYRKDDYRLDTDAGLASGDVAGFSRPSVGVSGAFDSLEAFGELQLPLLENKPLAKDVVFKGAYRYADNSLSGGANIYSAGGIWQVNDVLRFRGQYQRAIRVANAIELFLPTSTSFFSSGSGDPCAGAAPRATLAQCANSGVTAAQYGNIDANPLRQFNVLSGGNPNLTPEKSDTFTIGAIVQMPAPLEGLTISVDYFDITVNDFIGTANPIQSINNCVFDGDPLFCNLINRDPVSGSLWLNDKSFIEANNINTGFLFTSGIDINASYNAELPVNLGGLSLTLTGTYLNDLIEQSFPKDPKINCVGFYGNNCGTPKPRWRHIASLNWQTNHNVNARFSWRHFANVRAEPNLNADEGSFDEQLGAVDYFDLALTYRGLDNATIRLGINNVFDKEPPISTSAANGFGNGNTFPQVYDALGRFLFARVTVDY